MPPVYSKICVRRSLSIILEIGFQDQLSLMQVKSIAEYYRPSLCYHLYFKFFVWSIFAVKCLQRPKAVSRLCDSNYKKNKNDH